MKRLPVARLSLLLLLLLLPWGSGPLRSDDRKAADPKLDPETALMRRKLVASQKVLEAIALNEPERVVKYAEELVEISHKVEWRVLKTPIYEAYSTEFRDAARSMVRNAGKKNLDAATLDYVNLTLTCVKCHKHVREKRMAGK